jgi:hypothetical protein
LPSHKRNNGDQQVQQQDLTMHLQLSAFRRQNLAPHLKKGRETQGLAAGFHHAPRENRVQKSNTGPKLEEGRRTNPFKLHVSFLLGRKV